MNYAVLWDWDGVVIDSSRQHEESWERLAREVDKPLPPDHFVRGFGKKNRVIIPGILRWTDDPAEVDRLGRRKEAIYREMMVEEGLLPDLIPGVRAFLASVAARGWPSVVGTSTERENVNEIFRLLQIGDFFSGIVASEDVDHGKPDPEVFLKAAGLAGVAPERCVVFEDSIHGIQAGVAGGMRVVGVATTEPEDALYEHGAHAVIPDFEGRDASFIEKCLQPS